MMEYPVNNARRTTRHCCAHRRNMSPGLTFQSSSFGWSMRCELWTHPSIWASRLSSSHSFAEEVSMR